MGDTHIVSGSKVVMRYFHTVRHLRPVQVWGRLKLWLPTLGPSTAPAPRLRLRSGNWIVGRKRGASMLSPMRFRFLNREYEVRTAGDWAAPDREALWNYNLHYFDDLNAAGAEDRVAWHRQLIERWIRENPPVRKPGWDPFPTSLRLVNWAKWLWRGNAPVDGMVQSMAVQARWLARRIEYHLLGNHVLADAKGLMFAGLVFDGDEAEQWLRSGWQLMQEQLSEQVLADGGHFELSPMYHALMIEDLLDLVNAGIGVLDDKILGELRQYAARALGWLETLADEKGRVPLLNDATGGVAAEPRELHEYADRLGVKPDFSGIKAAEFAHGWRGRCCSGYWVLDKGPFRLWFDTAPIGPDYQPGHAHGDMLSVLMSFSGEQVLTDTGVSTYEAGAQRNYERSVAAHNTVRIDGLDQAEFWGAFRVARRGHPMGFRLLQDGIECGHDGFDVQRRGLFHARRLELRPDGFVVRDMVSGPGDHSFEVFWHFAPGLKIERYGAGQFNVSGKLRIELEGGDCDVGESCYSPCYGVANMRNCLRVSGSFSNKASLRLECKAGG